MQDTLQFWSFQSTSGEDSLACKGILGFEMEWQGRRVYIMNVHMQANAILDSSKRSTLTRGRQMEEMRRAVREVQANTRADLLVVCVDFNQEYSACIHIFQRPEWVGHAFIKSSLDIDYGVVFTRSSTSCTLTRSILPGLPISDHSPVLLQLCMKTGG